MAGLVLYGLDGAGATAFSERLAPADPAALRHIATERLRDWHAVEIWDGPMCVVRLRRNATHSG